MNIPTFALLLTSLFMIDPPVIENIWAYAELTTDDPVELAERCGVNSVKILATRTTQIATDGFSDDQKKRYKEVSAKIKDRYIEADRKDRARLFLELMEFVGNDYNRPVTQAWVNIDGMIVHYLQVFDLVTSNSITLLEDQTSGLYWSIVDESVHGVDYPRLFEIIHNEQSSEEERAAAESEIRSEESKQREYTMEVNGAVVFEDDTLQLNREEDLRKFSGAFQGMYQYLPESDGKKRLEMGLTVILNTLVKEDSVFKGIEFRLLVDPRHIPFDMCLVRGTSYTNASKSGGIRSFWTAPPREVLRDFFGKDEIPLPDPDLSYKKLKKKIL